MSALRASYSFVCWVPDLTVGAIELRAFGALTRRLRFFGVCHKRDRFLISEGQARRAVIE